MMQLTLSENLIDSISPPCKIQDNSAGNFYFLNNHFDFTVTLCNVICNRNSFQVSTGIRWVCVCVFVLIEMQMNAELRAYGVT